MKTLKHGIFGKEGIRVTCRACGCEYLIEDRKDFDIVGKIVKYYPKKYITEYMVHCPECGYLHYFGADPDIVQGKKLKKYASIFDRPDWIERYEVKYEENF